MSRIVLTTIGSLGDLHPFIAIGLGLRDRGHNIVFATIKDYRTKIESLGFEFHSRTIPRKQYSAVRVIKQLRELLGNPNYAAKAAEIGSIIQVENGLGVACDAIKQ